MSPSIKPKLSSLLAWMRVFIEEISALALFWIVAPSTDAELPTTRLELLTKSPFVLKVRLLPTPKALLSVKLSFNSIPKSPFVLIEPSSANVLACNVVPITDSIFPSALFTTKVKSGFTISTRPADKISPCWLSRDWLTVIFADFPA